MVLCECGCGTELPDKNKHGDPSHYVKGHHGRGKKLPEEQRKKISVSRVARFDDRGRKGPFWERYTPEYRAWRIAVFERDNYTCVECGHVGTEKERGFSAHHIKPYAQFPDLRHVVSNGETRCYECHMRLHGLTPIIPKEAECACGCGQTFMVPDKWGNRPKYVNGHAWRGKSRKELNPEGIEKMRQAKIGTKQTPEQVEANRQRGKARGLTPELRAAAKAHTDSLKGQPITEEQRQSLLRASKLAHTPEGRKKISEGKRGKFSDKQADALAKARAAEMERRRQKRNGN